MTAEVLPEAKVRLLTVAPLLIRTLPFATTSSSIVTPLLTTRVFSAVEAVTFLNVAVPAFPVRVTVVLGMVMVMEGAFVALLGTETVRFCTDFDASASVVEVFLSAIVIVASLATFCKVTVLAAVLEVLLVAGIEMVALSATSPVTATLSFDSSALSTPEASVVVVSVVVVVVGVIDDMLFLHFI